MIRVISYLVYKSTRRRSAWVCLFLGIAGIGDAAVWGSSQEEAEVIERVKAHAHIDYADYRVGFRWEAATPPAGWSFVCRAAYENYTNLLVVLEQQDQVVSRYVVPPNEKSPLAVAYDGEAYDAIEYLARMRPEWMNPKPAEGMPVIIQAVTGNQLDLTARLLDWGADVNSRGINVDTLMDVAGRRSLQMYELIRRRGGRASDENKGISRFKPEVRAQLVEKLTPNMLCMASNQLIWTNRRQIHLPPRQEPAGNSGYPFPAWRDLSGDESYELEKLLEEAGEAGGGTILLKYTEPLDRLFLQSAVIPILDRLNLVGLWIPPDGEPLPLVMRHDYFPLLPPVQPEDGYSVVPMADRFGNDKMPE